MNTAEISSLNSLIIAELSLAECYKLALRKLPTADLIVEFEELQMAHARRSQQLKKLVRSLKGTPVESTNKRVFMDTHAKESPLSIEDSLLSIFENLEADTTAAYSEVLNDLSGVARSVVENELIIEQEVTENVVNTLRTGMLQFAKSA